MVIKESSSVHWGPVWQKREDSENGQTARAVGVMMSHDRCGTTNLETWARGEIPMLLAQRVADLIRPQTLLSLLSLG